MRLQKGGLCANLYKQENKASSYMQLQQIASGKIFRFTAFVTSLVFTTTNVSWGQLGSPVGLAPGSSSAQFRFDRIRIPSELGRIESQQKSNPDAPLIVFIEDAHAILDAQANTRKLIHYLKGRYGIDLVAVEGGQGPFDVTLFRAFPDEKVKKKVFTEYLQRAELSAPEIAAILDEEGIEYHGIENWRLYEENYLAYLAAMGEREKLLTKLKALKSEFDQKRETLYAPKLNAFHKHVAAFQTEQTHLLELLKYLSGLTKELHANLGNYPHLAGLFDYLEKESALPRESVEISVRRLAVSFVQKYQSKLGRKTSMDLNAANQAFLSGQMDAGAFLRKLIEASRTIGLKPKLTAEMQEILGYTEMLSSIRGTKLFDELQAFLEETEERLVTRPEERELAGKYRKVRLLDDLVNLELTRKDLETYQRNTESYQSILGGERDRLKPALEFYRLALERDRTFQENLKSLLQRKKKHAVLFLAGGFHAEGFEKGLAGQPYSLVVVAPKMNSLAGKELYAGVMQGKISYKQYLQTTFYDAFARHASVNLMSGLTEPDFKKELKLWRDEVIRRLASEGRVGQAGEYTRYIDLLFKTYLDKFGQDLAPVSKEEVLKAVEKELDRFRDETVNNLWGKFQVKFKAFTSGLQMLIDKKELNERSVSALVDQVNQANADSFKVFSDASSVTKNNPALRAEVRDAFLGKRLPVFAGTQSTNLPFAGAEKIVSAILKQAKSQTPPSPESVTTVVGTSAVQNLANRIAAMDKSVQQLKGEVGEAPVIDETAGRILDETTGKAQAELPGPVNPTTVAQAIAAAVVGQKSEQRVQQPERFVRVAGVVDENTESTAPGPARVDEHRTRSGDGARQSLPAQARAEVRAGDLIVSEGRYKDFQRLMEFHLSRLRDFVEEHNGSDKPVPYLETLKDPGIVFEEPKNINNLTRTSATIGGIVFGIQRSLLDNGLEPAAFKEFFKIRAGFLWEFRDSDAERYDPPYLDVAVSQLGKGSPTLRIQILDKDVDVHTAVPSQRKSDLQNLAKAINALSTEQDPENGIHQSLAFVQGDATLVIQYRVENHEELSLQPIEFDKPLTNAYLIQLPPLFWKALPLRRAEVREGTSNLTGEVMKFLEEHKDFIMARRKQGGEPVMMPNGRTKLMTYERLVELASGGQLRVIGQGRLRRLEFIESPQPQKEAPSTTIPTVRPIPVEELAVLGEQPKQSEEDSGKIDTPIINESTPLEKEFVTKTLTPAQINLKSFEAQFNQFLENEAYLKDPWSLVDTGAQVEQLKRGMDFTAFFDYVWRMAGRGNQRVITKKLWNGFKYQFRTVIASYRKGELELGDAGRGKLTQTFRDLFDRFLVKAVIGAGLRNEEFKSSFKKLEDLYRGIHVETKEGTRRLRLKPRTLLLFLSSGSFKKPVLRKGQTKLQAQRELLSGFVQKLEKSGNEKFSKIKEEASDDFDLSPPDLKEFDSWVNETAQQKEVVVGPKASPEPETPPENPFDFDAPPPMPSAPESEKIPKPKRAPVKIAVKKNKPKSLEELRQDSRDAVGQLITAMKDHLDAERNKGLLGFRKAWLLLKKGQVFWYESIALRKLKRWFRGEDAPAWKDPKILRQALAEASILEGTEFLTPEKDKDGNTIYTTEDNPLQEAYLNFKTTVNALIQALPKPSSKGAAKPASAPVVEATPPAPPEASEIPEKENKSKGEKPDKKAEAEEETPMKVYWLSELEWNEIKSPEYSTLMFYGTDDLPSWNLGKVINEIINGNGTLEMTQGLSWTDVIALLRYAGLNQKEFSRDEQTRIEKFVHGWHAFRAHTFADEPEKAREVAEAAIVASQIFIDSDELLNRIPLRYKQFKRWARYQIKRLDDIRSEVEAASPRAEVRAGATIDEAQVLFRARHILGEAVPNAVKASMQSRGKKIVWISLEKIDKTAELKGTPGMALRISDSGPGLNLEDLANAARVLRKHFKNFRSKKLRQELGKEWIQAVLHLANKSKPPRWEDANHFLTLMPIEVFVTEKNPKSFNIPEESYEEIKKMEEGKMYVGWESNREFGHGFFLTRFHSGKLQGIYYTLNRPVPGPTGIVGFQNVLIFPEGIILHAEALKAFILKEIEEYARDSSVDFQLNLLGETFIRPDKIAPLSEKKNPPSTDSPGRAEVRANGKEGQVLIPQARPEDMATPEGFQKDLQGLAEALTPKILNSLRMKKPATPEEGRIECGVCASAAPLAFGLLKIHYEGTSVQLTLRRGSLGQTTFHTWVEVKNPQTGQHFYVSLAADAQFPNLWTKKQDGTWQPPLTNLVEIKGEKEFKDFLATVDVKDPLKTFGSLSDYASSFARDIGLGETTDSITVYLKNHLMDLLKDDERVQMVWGESPRARAEVRSNAPGESLETLRQRMLSGKLPADRVGAMQTLIQRGEGEERQAVLSIAQGILADWKNVDEVALINAVGILGVLRDRDSAQALEGLKAAGANANVSKFVDIALQRIEKKDLKPPAEVRSDQEEKEFVEMESLLNTYADGWWARFEAFATRPVQRHYKKYHFVYDLSLNTKEDLFQDLAAYVLRRERQPTPKVGSLQESYRERYQKNRTPFKSWLNSTIRNKLKDILREENRYIRDRVVTELGLLLAETKRPEEGNPSNLLSHRDLVEKIRDYAQENFPSPQSDVFLAIFNVGNLETFKQEVYKEMAQTGKYGKNEKAIKRVYYEALHQIEKAFKKDLIDFSVPRAEVRKVTTNEENSFWSSFASLGTRQIMAELSTTGNNVSRTAEKVWLPQEERKKQEFSNRIGNDLRQAISLPLQKAPDAKDGPSTALVLFDESRFGPEALGKRMGSDGAQLNLPGLVAGLRLVIGSLIFGSDAFAAPAVSTTPESLTGAQGIVDRIRSIGKLRMEFEMPDLGKEPGQAAVRSELRKALMETVGNTVGLNKEFFVRIVANSIYEKYELERFRGRLVKSREAAARMQQIEIVFKGQHVDLNVSKEPMDVIVTSNPLGALNRGARKAVNSKRFIGDREIPYLGEKAVAPNALFLASAEIPFEKLLKGFVYLPTGEVQAENEGAFDLVRAVIQMKLLEAAAHEAMAHAA